MALRTLFWQGFTLLPAGGSKRRQALAKVINDSVLELQPDAQKHRQPEQRADQSCDRHTQNDDKAGPCRRHLFAFA